MLQQLKDGKGLVVLREDDDRSCSCRRRYSLVKKENFTTNGIQKDNNAMVAQQYEVGLPFVCSANRKRFSTQLELSKHMDTLF